jgi:hypothetical protein
MRVLPDGHIQICTVAYVQMTEGEIKAILRAAFNRLERTALTSGNAATLQMREVIEPFANPN